MPSVLGVDVPNPFTYSPEGTLSIQGEGIQRIAHLAKDFLSLNPKLAPVKNFTGQLEAH